MGSFARKSMPITYICPPLQYKPRKLRVSYSVLTEQEKQRRVLDKYSSPQGFCLFSAGIFSSPGSMSSSSNVASSIGTWNSSQQHLTPPVEEPVEEPVEKKRKTFEIHPDVPLKENEKQAYEQFKRVGYGKIQKNKTLFKLLERYRLRVYYYLKTKKSKKKSPDKRDLAQKITKTMQKDLSLIGQLYLQTIRYSKSETERERYKELLQLRCENEQLFIKWRMKN